MDLSQYRAISPSLYAELKTVFDKHGFNVARITAGVDPDGGTVRLTMLLADANLKDEAGEPTTPEAAFYRLHCQIVSCKSEWLGQKFRMGGWTFTVAGMRNTTSAKSMLIVRDDGSRRICTPETLRGAFALMDQGISLSAALKRPLRKAV